MSPKEKMIKARQLIKGKKYDEARSLLETVNHPKAKEWLAKINKISPPAKSSKASKKAPAQKSSSSNMMPMIIGGSVLLVVIIVIVVAVFALPSLTGNSGDADETPATAVAENVDESDTDSGDEDEDETSEDDGDSNSDREEDDEETRDIDLTTSSVVPFISAGFLVNMTVPGGWVCDCDLSSGTLELADDPRTSVRVRVISSTFSPEEYATVPLADIVGEELDDDESLVSEETFNNNGREILHVVIADEDGDEERQYYVKDDDGQVIRFSIADRIENPEELEESVLFMAGNVDIASEEDANNLIVQLREDSLAYNADLNRWRQGDFLSDEYEHTFEMPDGWTLELNFIGIAIASKDGSSETSATAIALIPPGFDNDELSLEELATEFNEGSSDTVTDSGSVERNGREIYFYTAVSDINNSDTVTYMVRDSDGDLIFLIIQPQVVDKEAIHEDVLFMAGNVEAEEVDYMTHLIRAGIIEGDVEDDGYVPLNVAIP